MGSATQNLSGGTSAVPGWGDRWIVGFGGTWQVGDTFTVTITATDATLGYVLGTGTFGVLSPNVCFTYRERVYVGYGSQFNFSDNLDPTAWQLPAPGAGFSEYLSQFGSNDVVTAFGQLQGRMAVFGRRTIQIWTVDADPNNFALNQTLDNVGTRFPLSVQSLGDLDLLFLDETGFRSLRAKETTLNAFPDDIGSPVDELVQEALQTNTGPVCGITDPVTKDYWCYLDGKIYTLIRRLSSKITAWSTFTPTYTTAGVVHSFVPLKFATNEGKIVCRGSNGEFIRYGGATGFEYDGTVAEVELPWLDDKKPGLNKVSQGIGFVISGAWNISAGTDPVSGTLTSVISYGDGTNPAENKDSSYDIGRVGFESVGTHFRIKATTDPSSMKGATLSSLIYYYNQAEIQ